MTFLHYVEDYILEEYLDCFEFVSYNTLENYGFLNNLTYHLTLKLGTQNLCQTSFDGSYFFDVHKNLYVHKEFEYLTAVSFFNDQDQGC